MHAQLPPPPTGPPPCTIHCRYRQITPLVAAQCKASLQQQPAQRRVCFSGDSQTRHLFNQVVHLIEGPSAGFRNFDATQRIHSKLTSDVIVFSEDTYGDGALQLNTSKCSHVFINFGQWPASQEQEKPWDAKRYAEKVAQLADQMEQQQQQYGNRQFWVTTMPHPIHFLQRRKMPGHGWGVDRRTDPFIMLYNKVASTVMLAHGIPTVDLYSVASPLFDISYDKSHYLGTVGLAVAGMVADIVCSDFKFA